MSRILGALPALDLSSDGEAPTAGVDRLCDLQGAAARLKDAAQTMRRALAAIHRRSVADDVLGLNVSGADLVLVYAVSELEFASAMQEFAVISPAVRLGRIPTSEDLELLAERLAARPESP